MMCVVVVPALYNVSPSRYQTSEYFVEVLHCRKRQLLTGCPIISNTWILYHYYWFCIWHFCTKSHWIADETWNPTHRSHRSHQNWYRSLLRLAFVHHYHFCGVALCCGWFFRAFWGIMSKFVAVVTFDSRFVVGLVTLLVFSFSNIRKRYSVVCKSWSGSICLGIWYPFHYPVVGFDECLGPFVGSLHSVILNLTLEWAISVPVRL